MNYILIDADGIITEVSSDRDAQTLLQAFPDAVEARVKSDGTEYWAGRNIGEYAADGTLLPLADRVAAGYVKLSDRQKVQDGEIVEKLPSELVAEGLVDVPARCVLDGETIRVKTLLELYAVGEVSASEYNEIIRQQRKARYASESDPLRAEYVFDSETGASSAAAKKQAWIDKVNEIKAALSLLEE